MKIPALPEPSHPPVAVLSVLLWLAAGCAAAPGSLPVDDKTELPPPHATPSVTKRSRIVPQPAGAKLTVPQGFQVAVAAEGLQQPRMMALAPNGDLFVAESRAGQISVLRDADRDGQLETISVFASGLNQPFGMAFRGDFLYVGNTDGVVRFQYKSGQTTATGAPEKIADLPSGRGHWTRNVVFSPDGQKMYVAVGSASNNADGEEPRRAAINEYNPDGSGHRVFASGLRNPVGLAFLPGTATLWTTVNERDGLGDDLVPDYATSVREGSFYGWPYSYIGKHYDPDHTGKRPDLVDRAIVPDVLLPAHGAALAVAFYTGNQFPAAYGQSAFISLHGSWNRSRFSGYQIVNVPFSAGKPAGAPQTFLSGWIVSDEDSTVWGRPVGLLVWTDGSLLVADDGGNRIWRVSYKK